MSCVRIELTPITLLDGICYHYTTYNYSYNIAKSNICKIPVNKKKCMCTYKKLKNQNLGLAMALLSP
jgi:hypothetical protein